MAGYQSTDLVSFKVTMPLVNDGREEFFLISTPSQEPPPEIPEPATSALIGGGLIGLALLSRRFHKNALR
ncbi:MAG: PEP-CTERM sorting domain-containing protein [Bryobacteraceae bacterium]